MKEKFDIEGMTCTACAAAVERAAGSVDGVESAVVNFATEKLDVRYNPDITSAAQIEAAVQKVGYRAIPERPLERSDRTESAAKSAAQVRLMRDRMIYSLVFALPLFYLSMGPMMGLPIPPFLAGEKNMLANALTQLLLCLPVLYVGMHFYKDGFKALWHRVPNMDSLIAVGTSAAFIYSIYIFYRMCSAVSYGDFSALHHYAHDVYFESTVVILALISVGKYMETRAKGKTSQAIEKLIALAPDTATIIKDGKPVEVAIEQVHVGDTVLIKPGQRIPVDGVITKGSSAVDESLITGESIPVEKDPGDTVVAGAINKTGTFEFEASRVGADTSLAKIITLVEEAQSSKAPIAKLADTISRYFVPAVMGIALAAFLIWLLLGYGFSFALSVGIAVLVISCPCALGLATPTAIMVGTGVGAQHGILFKNGEALESLGKTQKIVFDKTGTLTIGHPVVTDVLPAAPYSDGALLRLCAALEAKSEHPLSEAIVTRAQERNLILPDVADFKAIPGRGVSGTVDGKTVLIGNQALMAEHGVALGGAAAVSDTLSDQGKTALFVATGAAYAGTIAAADILKESSTQAVAQLEHMGIEVYMLTGDNRRTAAAIAAQAGIKHVIAEVLPDQKAQAITDLQRGGANVTMVGDGINDAPALAQANNGIAVGTGTDVAIESADVILMQNNIMQIPAAVQLSQATLKNIRQNLFWAFFYNVICIPLAAGVLYIPFGIKLNAMFAAAAMSLSSVSVVLNALSLKTFKTHFPKLALTPSVPAVDVLGNPACPAGAPAEHILEPKTDKEQKMEVVFSVKDMSCMHCVNRVKQILEDFPGVLNAQVSLENQSATIECEPGTDLELLAQQLTDAGYPAAQKAKC